MAKVDRSGILKATLTNSFPPKIKAIVETSKKTLDRKKKKKQLFKHDIFWLMAKLFLLFTTYQNLFWIKLQFNSNVTQIGDKKSSRFWYAVRTASRQISWRLTNNSGESDNNQRQMYSNVFYCQIKRCWRPRI